MNDLKLKFLNLYAVEGKTYPQIEKALNVDREKLQELYNQTKVERSRIAKLKAIYKRKGFKQTVLGEFLKKYEELEREQQCYYCGITQAEIAQLIELKLIRTKRLETRGKQLELERVEPNELYENLNNIKLACYWCNNAKSDEFSADEFKPAGKHIGEVFKNRLRQKQGSSD